MQENVDTTTAPENGEPTPKKPPKKVKEDVGFFNAEEEYAEICRIYAIDTILPATLRTTDVMAILRISRPTALKVINNAKGFTLGLSTYRREHRRIAAPLFLAYLKEKWNENRKEE